MPITESQPLGVDDALQTRRSLGVRLLAQLELNQGRPTITGRLTLEQFADLTVVHNRRWADGAGATIDVVTQREIIDAHADGLAVFLLQGLIDATVRRAALDGSAISDAARSQLDELQTRVGKSVHYGIPQVTLVLRQQPQLSNIGTEEEVVATRVLLPAGTLFVVADGQHRREAARRVKDFLTEAIANQRIPPKVKFVPSALDGEPFPVSELEAWQAVQETFRTHSFISYEAHIGLSIDEARQMFTNYNCHVKPVKAQTNLEFDQSNPVNRFAKGWLTELLTPEGSREPLMDLQQMAQVNGFLFLGKGNIRSAPYNVDTITPIAQHFWQVVTSSPAWSRPGSLIRQVAVLKGLAKAWFHVYVARRNKRPGFARRIESYITAQHFDDAWVSSVPGLDDFVVRDSNGSFARFQPSHNDIVALIVKHTLSDEAGLV